MRLFDVNLLLILRPKSLKFVTNSNSFPLTTIGSKDLDFALNEILNSLHLSGLSCILFSTDHIDTESDNFSVQFLKLLNHQYTSKNLLVLLQVHLLIKGIAKDLVLSLAEDQMESYPTLSISSE